ALLAALGLQREFLFDNLRVHRDLVLVEEVGESAIAFGAGTNDRGWFTVARREAKLAERVVHRVVVHGIHGAGLPAVGGEDALDIGHGEDHAIVDIELAVVAIDEDAEIIEALLGGVHHRLPDRAFLEFAVADHAIGVEARGTLGGDGKAFRHAEALAHGAGGDLYAGEQWAGMSVKNALVRARVLQQAAIEVAELRVNRSHGCDRVAFAENERVLAGLGWIRDIEIEK